MQKTGIEYLDYTWNPIVMRCGRVSPGCDNCWHLTTAGRLCMNQALPKDERLALAGGGPFILRDRELSAPLRKRAHSVIGVQFMGDLFHEAVSNEMQGSAYFSMHESPQHTFLILTKRPQKMSDYVNAAKSTFDSVGDTFPWPNIWHGLTVCNQQEANSKIPEFLKVPGKKFLSIEPMLGAIDLYLTRSDKLIHVLNKCDHYPGFEHSGKYGNVINAVILGGETGPGARPLHPDWVRSVRDQCAAAGVPFFFKQWGEWAPARFEKAEGCINHTNGHYWYEFDPDCGNFIKKIGKKKAGRLLDGRTHDELPWRKA